MTVRRRKRPFTQGYIKKIYELFFQPLVRVYKQPGEGLHEFLDMLFDVQHRYITRYRVKQPFQIEGPLYVAGWAKVQGIGKRKIPKGSVVWVREDLREPDYVDVEIVTRGREDQVFYVERLHWERYKLSCINLDLDKEV